MIWPGMDAQQCVLGMLAFVLGLLVFDVVRGLIK